MNEEIRNDKIDPLSAHHRRSSSELDTATIFTAATAAYTETSSNETVEEEEDQDTFDTDLPIRQLSFRSNNNDTMNIVTDNPRTAAHHRRSSDEDAATIFTTAIMYHKDIKQTVTV